MMILYSLSTKLWASVLVLTKKTQNKQFGCFARFSMVMETSRPRVHEVMVECVHNGAQYFFKKIIEYEDPHIWCGECGVFGHSCRDCKWTQGVDVPAEVSKQPRIEVSDSNAGHQDELPTGEQDPSGGLFPMEVRPSEIPKLISPSRATVGHWEDDKDDDDFRVEDGQLQSFEAVSSKRTESVSGLPLSSRGLPSPMVSSGTIMASRPRRVEVVHDDILAMDEALQMATEALLKWEGVIEVDHLVKVIHMGLMLIKHLV
ncbi:hypothetical protein NE237_001765 [Protea cynaroides]|uniref:Uncharacterized protein n=1 Tax=Protea cynaroides TaxID=273540 RepID=A0A9Q0KUR5_9MAGN|nr:hypothetical protein NE237_001765 [Protea cynaroides]